MRNGIGPSTEAGPSAWPLSADLQASLSPVKALAAQQDPKATREAARQFEALFMHEMLKSMREATLKSGLSDEQQDLATPMLDQQLAQMMSGRPGGLADLLERQLNPTTTLAKTPAAVTSATPPVSPEPLRSARPARSLAAPISSSLSSPISSTVPASVPAPASRFVREQQRAATQVSRESGIPSAFLLGQAGHESGWGQREIKATDGTPSHNLFGIKAGSQWKGRVVEVTTTEYIQGQPRKVQARFRAYDSYTDAFRDFARLIKQAPRYAAVRQQAGGTSEQWATSLAQAGYATDPRYAEKLSRAINSTLKLQRLSA